MNNQVLIEVKHLKKYFVKNQGIISMLQGKKKYIKAVDNVGFKIKRGEILCVAGESGCGKTTLGKTVLKLLEPDEGRIIYKGKDITSLGPKEMKPLRTEIQVIFQDPYESLNPRATIYKSVAEPLVVNHLVKNEREKRSRVIHALELAKLMPVENYLYKYPHNLSGGEKQRVGIAIALVLEPEFIIADEPTSMLDVSVQANLLVLLKNLKKERNLTFLFITHDLAVAYVFSDWLAIMYLGKFVEIGPTEEVISSPIHPYTKALISVVPTIDLSRRKAPVVLPGEIPDAGSIPSGCRFHPRCSQKVGQCTLEEPVMEEFSPGHYAACFVEKKKKSININLHKGGDLK